MRRVISGIIILLTIVLAGCGGGGGSRTSINPPTDSGIQVSVLPSEITLAPRDNYQFTAGVTGATNPAVRWSVEEEIDGGIVTSSGRYTAPSTEGPCHVRVTSVEDPSKSDTATVTVSGSWMPPPGQTGVTVRVVPHEVYYPRNMTMTFTAIVTGHSNTAVIWTVEEADGGIITSDGVYTTPDHAVTAHVKATSVADPSKSDTATVIVFTILPPIPSP